MNGLEHGKVYFLGDELNIQLAPQVLEEQMLEVINLEGKVVYRANFGLTVLPILRNVQLNIPDGIYTVVYHHGNRIESITLKK